MADRDLTARARGEGTPCAGTDPIYERETDRARDAEAPGRRMPAGHRSHGAQGTTHDPNAVTTGSSAEPDDAHPPKGVR